MKKLFIQFFVYKTHVDEEHLEYSLINDNINVKIVVEVDEKILLSTLVKQNKEVSDLIRKYAVLDIEKDYTMERLNFFDICNAKEQLKREERDYDELVLESDTLLKKIFSELFLHMDDVDYTVTVVDINYKQPHYSLINLDR